MPDGGAAGGATALWTQDRPWIDPCTAAGAFADVPVVMLLDSATEPVDARSRYAFLCVDAFAQVVARAGDRPDPLAALQAAWQRAGAGCPPGAGQDGAMPFRGGAVGLIGYAVGAALHGVACPPGGADDPPDLVIGLFDLVIGFDRRERICRIHASGLPARGGAQARRARARMQWAEQRLARVGRPATAMPGLRWRADWSPAEYAARVRRVLAYIAAGDIYQANLTMRHQAARPPGLDGWAVQAALRRANPAPFGAWLRMGAHDLCCASPERFVRIAPGGHIATQPIKGTAARDGDPGRDAAALAGLLASAKDRAENVMIVDVLRHDIGRVATLGSVAVPALCAPESFATVHHLVSTITARLRPDCGPIDLLRAVLPGGSITGAPKIRAMQIIAEVEGVRRGPYCGCVVAIGWDGTMDSNIVIRSLVLTPERVIAQAGGAIVAESDPAAEYAEMMLKSATMRGLFAAPA